MGQVLPSQLIRVPLQLMHFLNTLILLLAIFFVKFISIWCNILDYKGFNLFSTMPFSINFLSLILE